MLKNKNKKNTFIKIFAFLMVFTVLLPQTTNADFGTIGLDPDTKNCNYISNQKYQLFSDIDPSFAAFKALGATSNGGCIQVSGSLNRVFDAFFKILVGIASVAAIVNIAYAGIKTMLAESGAVQKGEWKKTVVRSLEGLLIALVSWLILSTINNRTLTGFQIPNSISRGIAEGRNASIQAVQNAEYQQKLGVSAGNSGSNGGGSSQSYLSPEVEAQIKEYVQSSGLSGLNPSDLKDFFPSGTATDADWARLVKQIANEESGLKGNDLYAENFGKRPPAGTPGRIPDSEYPKNSKPGKLSIGMMSLSWDDPEVLAKGYTERDLQDPAKNLEVGTQILKNRIESGGCIACGNKGGAAYWSVLRGEKKQTIINSLK